MDAAIFCCNMRLLFKHRRDLCRPSDLVISPGHSEEFFYECNKCFTVSTLPATHAANTNKLLGWHYKSHMTNLSVYQKITINLHRMQTTLARITVLDLKVKTGQQNKIQMLTVLPTKVHRVWLTSVAAKLLSPALWSSLAEANTWSLSCAFSALITDVEPRGCEGFSVPSIPCPLDLPCANSLAAVSFSCIELQCKVRAFSLRSSSSRRPRIFLFS